MATNEPTGDNARKGAVRKRTQLRSKAMGETTYQAGQGLGQVHESEEGARKEEFKGVRREKKAV